MSGEGLGERLRNRGLGYRDHMDLIDEAATALASAEARIAELTEAMRHIKPYLVYTVGPESPGHHPTMPSAVDAFLAALARARSLEKQDG